MTIILRALNLSTLSLLLSSSALAHHSNAPHFDADIEVTNTGIVTAWKFINPHAFLYFDVTNDDGTVAQWRCETDAASGLKRRGYSSDTFKIGEQVSVTGNPARREDNHCFFRDFTFADGTAVNRNTDVSTLGRGQKLETNTQNAKPFEATLLGDEPNISGFWWDGDDTAPSAPLTTPPTAPAPSGGMTGMGMGISSDGSLPPRLARIAAIGLTPAGQAIQDKYERIYDDPALHCEISNIMDALGRDESVNEIRQNGQTITILYGYMDYLRTVHMNMDAHPDGLTPTPGGHSIGKWDGDALVIDTVSFTPSVLNAQVGIPTSQALHVTERLTFDEQSGEITREYTATDPINWTDTHSGSDALRRSNEAYSPYNCETLSGLNNLRPGTPEYDAEAKRMEAAAQNAGANVPATAKSGTGKLWLFLLAALAVIAGLIVRARKKA